MTNEAWEAFNLRNIPPAEVEASFIVDPPRDGRDPAVCALAFVQALQDPVRHRDSLLRLTTPESHEAWGDFTAAAAALEAIDRWAVCSGATTAVDDPAVAYVAVLSGVDESFEMPEGSLIMAAAAISLVWRPERGYWLVHAFGGDFWPPEDMPRGF